MAGPVIIINCCWEDEKQVLYLYSHKEICGNVCVCLSIQIHTYTMHLYKYIYSIEMIGRKVTNSRAQRKVKTTSKKDSQLSDFSFGQPHYLFLTKVTSGKLDMLMCHKVAN